MRIYLSFTIAASKMFFRRKSSIFWSLFFPVVTMLVLGNAGFIGYSAPNVGLFYTTSNEIIDELKSSKSITIREYQSKDNALEALEKGTLSALITLNQEFKYHETRLYLRNVSKISSHYVSKNICKLQEYSNY